MREQAVFSLRGARFTRPAAGQDFRLIALLQFRNEMKYLPGWFENVLPQVDGIIALDDGSTDGSDTFARAQPRVLELLQNPPSLTHVPAQNEVANQKALICAVTAHAPAWIVVVDADERLEDSFRARALIAIALAEARSVPALRIRYRELWDGYRQFRTDGIWRRKWRNHLFKWSADHVFDERALHNQWAPKSARFGYAYPHVDIIKYHLRMVRAEDRAARVARYRVIDPQNRWQPAGYDYLSDEAGLKLQDIAQGRGYSPIPRE